MTAVVILQSDIERLKRLRPTGSRFVIEVQDLIGVESYKNLISSGKTTKEKIIAVLQEQMKNTKDIQISEAPFVSQKDMAARNHL